MLFLEAPAARAVAWRMPVWVLAEVEATMLAQLLCTQMLPSPPAYFHQEAVRSVADPTIKTFPLKAGREQPPC